MEKNSNIEAEHGRREQKKKEERNRINFMATPIVLKSE